MLAYVLRRLGYGVVVVLGVLLFLFILFFTVASPDDVARRALGEKALPEVIEQWKANHGYDRPLWPWQDFDDNMLFEHYRRMLTFDFGRSDADDVLIIERLRQGAGPSLALTVPLFVVGITLGIVLSLFVAFFRETYIDRTGVFLCVLGMSVSILLYIVGAQYLIAKLLRWFPISGFDSDPAVIGRFLALPLVVGTRQRRGRRRALLPHGLHRGDRARLRAHGPRQGLPARFASWCTTCCATPDPDPHAGGARDSVPVHGDRLLLESFFGIPGLGAITVDAINGNDFSTLRTMVFIGALLFVVGQIATDVSYALVDPRVRLE